MNNIDSHPKSIKKAVRHIKQDTSKEQLLAIKKLMGYAIDRRIQVLEADKQKLVGKGRREK